MICFPGFFSPVRRYYIDSVVKSTWQFSYCKCILHSAALLLSSASHCGDTGLIPGQFKVRYVVDKWQWESVIPPVAPASSHGSSGSILASSCGLCGGQSDDGKCVSECLCFLLCVVPRGCR